MRADPLPEALGVRAERGVEQPDLDRARGAQRSEGRSRQLPGEPCADPPGQQVRPVLGPVQAAHVAVVGVEDDVLTRVYAVRRKRKRDAARRGVAGQGRDHQMGVGLDDLANDIVDGVQVAPRLHGRVLGRLDDVQVDAVREEVGASHQHDDLRLPARARIPVGVAQTPALPGAHGAVVEVEVQVADPRLLLVGDVAPGALARRPAVERHGDLGRVQLASRQVERERRRELEVPVPGAGPPEVGDPYGAVGRGPADRSVPLCDELARRARQLLLAVDAEQVKLGAGHLVENPGVALGGADLADHGLGGVRPPVDRAHVLLHQRPRTADHPRGARVRGRPHSAVEGPVDRLDQRVDRRAADLVPVDAALVRPAHRERPRGPHVTGVVVAVGLEHRRSPLACAQLDRPVERGGAPVAHRSRVHDEAAVLRPDRLRDHLLEHRADDQVRQVPGHGGLHRLLAIHHVHLHSVAAFCQGDVRTLAETVVRRDEEQDATCRASGGHVRDDPGHELSIPVRSNTERRVF